MVLSQLIIASMYLVISITEVSMDAIRHIRWPAKIASGDNFLVKIAKNWLNRVKPGAISWQRQNLQPYLALPIPGLNPAGQAFGVMGLGIIPDKINLTHMPIQISQSLDKLLHYLAALALVYVVVYLAGVCLQRAEDHHFASGFPERRNFPYLSSFRPLLARIWPHQIRPGLIKIKGYLATLVHRPKRPVDTVFLTSYSGSGELIQRLERLYEYPSPAITLRIYSGLIVLTILIFTAIWHNALKLQLLQANPNSLGLVLSNLAIFSLCFCLISLGRPGENLGLRELRPPLLNRLIHIRTLIKCKSTILAISATFKRWILESQITLARLYSRVLLDLSNSLIAAFSLLDNFLTKIGRMVTSFAGNHYSRLSQNIEVLFSGQGTMAYIKRFLIISFALLLTGCSTLAGKDKTFEAGYRQGVKENVEDFAQNFYGNDFPYFYWQSPVVQNVLIPAHIANGVFVPEHNEPVVIEPGKWRKEFGYPINCPKGKRELEQKEGGEPYAFNYLNFSVRDITVLPEAFTCAKPGREDKDTGRGTEADSKTSTATR